MNPALANVAAAAADGGYTHLGHAPHMVVLSVLIAIFASYVALDLAKRVRTPNPVVSRTWLGAGTIVMGSGIWAMHFIGMNAARFPFEIGYAYGMTALSWLAAVLASGLALWVASRGAPSPLQVVGAAVVMGGGVAAMHYIGISAVELAPGIRFDPASVVAAIAVAVIASYVALRLFIGLRHLQGKRAVMWQGVAAIVMGLAIAGLHYTGMAGTTVALGSICTSLGGLSGSGLGTIVGGGAAMLLAQTLLNSLLDAHVQHRAAGMADSLVVANQKLQHIAFHDALTQLPNRLVFEDRLQQATARCDRDGSKLALLFIDLDGFKPVNDSWGHLAGDAVLHEIAVRLQAAVRPSDAVARIGGDEFVMLIGGGEDALPVAELADRVARSIEQPMTFEGHEMLLSASIGIAVYPQDGPAAKLIPNADSAMYTAKRAGSGGYRFFEAGMDAGARAQLEMLNELRLALVRNELELYYQPKVDAMSGQITGAEALVRWRHPQRGIVGPVEFIPIAERFGLIGQLGAWVIDDACRQMSAWRDDGLSMRVAVNLSVHQLHQIDLVQRIEGALARHAVDPGHLTCEITESTAMEDSACTLELLGRLTRAGVRLSIDDFGTGYSSLSYLRKLPAQQLKIDRSFVSDIETSADARAIVEGVVRLAHALGLKVVAEGVETHAQRELLMAVGCDELQGYLLGKPMPAAQISEWAVSPSERSPTFRPSIFEAA